jgi:beta-glucosidase
MLLGNYNGEPSDPVTPLRGIREALPNARVIHAIGSALADGFPVAELVPSSALSGPDGRPGLRVEYFGDTTMTGTTIASSTDSLLAARWGAGAPRDGMSADNFAVRWTGTITPRETGAYGLALMGTMKFRLFLDDSLVARSQYQATDEYPDPRVNQTAALQLVAGRAYRIRVEARESYGDAQLQLLWAMPPATLEAEAVRAATQADAVVLFLGLTPRLEGEEMRVEVPGFRGGDRTNIDLPAPQQRLLERMVAIGKPTVLVLLSGSAVAINWADGNVPAIVAAWYPGQAAGRAIADVRSLTLR